MLTQSSRESSRVQSICCIGAGYVGGPTCAVIADKCPNIVVNVVDLNEDRIKAWNKGPLPIHEPGLEEVVNRTRNRNLFFTTNVASAIEAADIIFISVNTPTKTYGKGSGAAADLTAVESAAKSIMKYSTRSKIVVEKSTVPCGTANALAKLFRARELESDIKFEIVSNPEFLAEGTAMNDLFFPDRVLIGGCPTPSGRIAQQILGEVYANWVPRERICMTNVWSSELAKLAANAMLAQRVSSINSISAICEKTGANIEEIAAVVGMDTRIGSKFLKSGLGFGGSCFLKDVLSLCYLSESLSLPEVANYWRQVLELNDFQRNRFIDTIVSNMFGTVRNKKITIFGFAFKKNTADTRESPAIHVVGQLLIEGAIVQMYDPLVKAEQARADLLEYGYGHVNQKNFICFEDPYEACEGSSAIVTCTEWDEFRTYDYQAIYSMMDKPAYVFDGRLVLDIEKLPIYGFQVFSLGKGHS
jgi:UDPglucose 6-dehydrogenase